MAPCMQMKKFPLTVIRPLCLVNEEDIASLATIAAYPQQVKRCPYERDSNREQMKQLLGHLEKLNPEARYNLWGSMSNIQHELLPPHIDKTNKTIEKCTSCLPGYSYMNEKCDICPGGYFSQGGISVCEKCPNNKWSHQGSSSCFNCPEHCVKCFYNNEKELNSPCSDI